MDTRFQYAESPGRTVEGSGVPVAGEESVASAPAPGTHATWRESGVVFVVALISFLAHLAVSSNYGYFRDELYYIAAGNHLAFGYVDFPPLIAWLAALTRLTVGDSLIAIHIWAAVANALLVVVTGLVARELGGGRIAQGLAALASAACVSYFTAGSIFSMDALDQLWWALGAFVVVRMIRRQEPRLWLLFGVVTGVGLLTKVTVVFFGASIVFGCLLSPARTYMRSRWLWLGGAVAAVLSSPYVLWNAANGWPTVEFWRGYGDKLASLSFADFVGQQVYTANPFLLPLWLGGLGYFLFTPRGRPYRVFGLSYLFLFAIFALSHAKSYFLTPAYVPLFAGGGLVAEALVRQRFWRRLIPAYVVALAVFTVAIAPIGMPIIPPATWVQVYGFLGADAGAQMEEHQPGALPQWLGDRLGWESMVEDLAKVYNGLPEDQRSSACIYTGNYGEAGAVDLFGPKYGLPRAVSGHNNYFLWGTSGCPGGTVVGIGVRPRDLTIAYASVIPVETHRCEFCMPFENNLPIYVATQPKVSSLDAIWPSARFFK